MVEILVFAGEVTKLSVLAAKSGSTRIHHRRRHL